MKTHTISYPVLLSFCLLLFSIHGKAQNNIVSEKKVSNQANAYWLKPAKQIPTQENKKVYNLPFTETWDEASFDYQDWDAGSKWHINTNIGNPKPTAGFSSNDTLTNYFCLLKSPELNTEILIDGKIELKLDIKLSDISQSGTESLKIYLKTTDKLYQIDEIVNDTSAPAGWQNYSWEISSIAKKQNIRLYIAAVGEYSGNIDGWYVDNIAVEHFCYPPYGFECDYDYMNSVFNLNWMPPCTYFQGWIKYHDGTFENGLASTNGGSGLAQLFQTSNIPVIITKIRWFYSSGSGIEEIYILNKHGDEIIGGPYLFENDTMAGSWIEMDVDSVRIEDTKFMIATINDDENGPYVGVDDSFYDGNLFYGSIGDWTELSELGEYYYTGSHMAYVFIPDSNTRNKELLGYNVYREVSDNGFYKINDELLNQTYFNDSLILDDLIKYFVTAEYIDCTALTDTLIFWPWGSVNNKQFSESLIIFPNPASKVLRIISEISFDKLFLFTSNGNIIFFKQNLQTKEYSIDVSGYPGGLYFLKVRTKEGMEVYKIVIG